MPQPPSAPRKPSRQPLRRTASTGPWRFGKIPVIGLVGGIGSGKSTVASFLADLGAHVLDADAIGHALLDQPPTRQAILRRFGPSVLCPDNPDKIHRPALAALVFNHPDQLRDLERILHPRMRLTFEKAIARTLRRHAAPAIVLDAAILFEAGWDDLCDVIWFIDTPRPLRLQRLAASRGWSPQTLQAREAAQWPLDQKKRAASAIIPNTGDTQQLHAHVARLWAGLQKTARRFRALSLTDTPSPDHTPLRAASKRSQPSHRSQRPHRTA
ncbi:MAG: dephospho-CoA kinase [Isosphaeraceae bacterium]|nr:MAG: dephospho-CoA kinase [Isosphaeraceae bacterium]